MSRRKDKQTQSEDVEKMSKKEEEIAKYVRFNCPTATTLFEGNEVHYFSGNKAVDTLWDSKYGAKAKSDPFFKTRDEAFHYIADLFSKQLFFRAKKLVPKKKEDKNLKTDTEDVTKSPKKEVEKRKDKKAKEEETETEAEEKKDDKKESTEKDEKKKKKVKLLVHQVQVFSDDKDVYVWVFDPTPFHKKVIGVLMLLGTIVGCLFPLWPMWLRQGVYYLSLGGIGVFASIIVVAILRTILFGIIYAVTFGKHKLWILPNLTEDCGVLESFQPWYTYEYCSGDESSKKASKKDKKKAKKDKNSDNEEEEENKNNIEEVKDDENEEKFSQESSDDNYEKIDEKEESEEITSSVPPSPADATVRKRRAPKV